MKENKGNFKKWFMAKFTAILAAIGITIGGAACAPQLAEKGTDSENQRTEAPLDITNPDMAQEYAEALDDVELDKKINYIMESLNQEQRLELSKEMYKEVYMQSTGEELGDIMIRKLTQDSSFVITLENGQKAMVRSNSNADEVKEQLDEMGIEYGSANVDEVFDIDTIPDGEYSEITIDGLAVPFVSEKFDEKGPETLPIITMRQIEQMQNGEKVNLVANNLPLAFWEKAVGDKNYEATNIRFAKMIKGKPYLERIVDDFIQGVENGEIGEDGKRKEEIPSYSENVSDLDQLRKEYNDTRDNFLESIKFVDSEENIDRTANNNEHKQIEEDREV